jgi:hypothetical protein
MSQILLSKDYRLLKAASATDICQEEKNIVRKVN